MAETQNIQQQIVEFEKQRQLLMNISLQKQQLQASLSGAEQSLKELSNTKEEKVFKIIGNILIQKDTKEVAKELEESKESTSLRLKTVEKQEENLLTKLNALRQSIESAAKSMNAGPAGAASNVQGDKTVLSSKNKSKSE